MPQFASSKCSQPRLFIRTIFNSNCAQNDNVNSIAFGQTATGVFQRVVVDFDFRVSSPADDPADGFSFMLIPTSLYGTNGPGVLQGVSAFEEPSFGGVFGIGFDVYPRGTQNDVSAHWNSVEYQNVTMVNSNINLTAGVFHHANVLVVYEAGGARVSVTLTPNINGTVGPPYIPINNLFIPGLSNFSSRVEFGGRTGGLNMSVDLDNILVRYGYETGVTPFEEFTISSALPLLLPGANVLAIHGLNVATNDPDFLLVPELVARDLTVQTEATAFFGVPTPGGANEGGAAGIASEPKFLLAGGVYTNDVVVVLATSVPGGVIRYTTNGSEPTATSAVYAGDLTLANSAVVRARVYAPGLLPSPIVSQTYTLLDTDLLTFTSNLPLVIIDTFGDPHWVGFEDSRLDGLHRHGARSGLAPRRARRAGARRH